MKGLYTLLFIIGIGSTFAQDCKEPILRLNSYTVESEMNMTATQMISMTRLNAVTHFNCEEKKTFFVQSFTMKIVYGEKEKLFEIDGDLIEDKHQKIFRKLSSGDFVEFSNIVVADAEAKIYEMIDFVVTVS